jgi:hypothetical protein
MTGPTVCAVCRHRGVPPDRSVCFTCVPDERHDMIRRVADAAGEMLAELERDYGNGVRNGYWPEMGVKIDRWRAALGLPPLERYSDGVADFVAPVVRQVPQDGDVRGPAEYGGREEGPPVQVGDHAGRVGGNPALLPGVCEGDDTSGHGGFDHSARTRFVGAGTKVRMNADPLGGQFAQVMTPEQAEYLSRHLARLAAEARRERGRQFPGLYPEDSA